MPELRAITTSVEYHDYLALTLPHNAHHFAEIHVVTSPADHHTIQVATQHDANLIITNKFFQNQAPFAKFAAIEHALDTIGRTGWICLIDADTLWPTHIDWPQLQPNNIYGPPRRILNPITLPLPPETNWNKLPISPNSLREFPGYSQIFHASDIHLPSPPWHDTSIPHAGKGDSLFQNLWPRTHKTRLPFEALHLGKNGQDWAGRTTNQDGSPHPKAQHRKQRLKELRSTK